MKKLLLIFLLSFILNFIWENGHAPLYAAYKGWAITEFILTSAALGDALILSVLFLPLLFMQCLKGCKWLIIPIGFTVSTLIELFALNTGRWAYNSLMPVVPFFNVGLSPFLQLGITGYIAYVIAA